MTRFHLYLLALIALLATPAFAQEESPGSEEETAAEEANAEAETTEGEADPPPSWCDDREPMQIILAYDDGKYFKWVQPAAVRATEALTRTFCPGDVVRVASYATELEWMGESVMVQGEASREEIARQIRKRDEPDAGNSINDNLVKAAFDEWDRVGVADDGLLALYVFTDTMHSDAPSRGFYTDYAWDALPAYLRGRLLLVVSQHDIRVPDAEPILHVTGAPAGFHLTDFPSGRGTTFADIQRGFERVAQVAAEARAAAERPTPGAAPPPPEPAAPAAIAPEPDSWESVLLSIPGLVLSGLVLALILALAFALGRRGGVRRSRPAAEGEGAAARILGPDITLMLRDRFSGSILREETRALEDALRIGAGREVDFYVPGPYALEILPTHGGKPSVRSSNLLGIEILREGGRRQAINDHDLVPVHSGDRFDLGGGHEIEVRLEGA